MAGEPMNNTTKAILLFSVLLSICLSVVTFVMSLVVYPDFKDQSGFEHGPFVLMMILGSTQAVGCFVNVVKIVVNRKKPTWWMYSLDAFVLLISFVLWVWNIVVLNSHDGTILEHQYRRLYHLMLVYAIISGILWGVLVCACCIITLSLADKT